MLEGKKRVPLVGYSTGRLDNRIESEEECDSELSGLQVNRQMARLRVAMDALIESAAILRGRLTPILSPGVDSEMVNKGETLCYLAANIASECERADALTFEIRATIDRLEI